MKPKQRVKRLRALLVVGSVAAAIIALAACAPSSSNSASSGSAASVPAVKPAANAAGVITAASWKEMYPQEYATYVANEENSTKGGGVFKPRGNMIEMYPQITTIWAGNGFSKSYFEPNGHQYALEDISASGRVSEKTLANCLTCKSADFTAMYQAQGDAIFSQPFAQVRESTQEPISCYNCHENEPTTLATTQKFFVNGLGSDASKVPMSAQVCGQCHNEYYFNADTKAVTNPYTSLEGMTPEAIYQFYTDKGFSDATNEATGIGWIKVQHPEFEFVYGGKGSSMAQRINGTTGEKYSCADCHMGVATKADDGSVYRSHLLVSPLENKELLETCNIAGCHTDLAAEVASWQKESEGKVQAVGDALVTLNGKIASVKDTADAQAKALYREAQFYWEFVMVENSEGAHNPTLSNKCLDRAQTLIDQALAMVA